jgi:hypothetical protein
MKSGKGKGRGGCRGLAKRRRGNGGGREIGLDWIAGRATGKGRREGAALISAAGVARKESQWDGWPTAGAAGAAGTAGTVLGLHARFPGLACKRTLVCWQGGSRGSAGGGKDSKDRPSSARLGSADRQWTRAQSTRLLQLMGTIFALMLKMEVPIVHRGWHSHLRLRLFGRSWWCAAVTSPFGSCTIPLYPYPVPIVLQLLSDIEAPRYVGWRRMGLMGPKSRLNFSDPIENARDVDAASTCSHISSCPTRSPSMHLTPKESSSRAWAIKLALRTLTNNDRAD